MIDNIIMIVNFFNLYVYFNIFLKETNKNVFRNIYKNTYAIEYVAIRQK